MPIKTESMIETETAYVIAMAAEHCAGKPRVQADGSIVVTVDDPDADDGQSADEMLPFEAPLGWRVEWTGHGNDDRGRRTSDIVLTPPERHAWIIVD
jgi:hypothetical protein